MGFSVEERHMVLNTKASQKPAQRVSSITIAKARPLSQRWQRNTLITVAIFAAAIAVVALLTHFGVIHGSKALASFMVGPAIGGGLTTGGSLALVAFTEKRRREDEARMNAWCVRGTSTGL